MKRTLSVLLAAGLLAGMVGGTADAKKKKPKAVKTTLYFHGNEVVGETESNALAADVPLPMTAAKPTAAEPRSRQITNGVATPNERCAGNTLFPVWRGDVSGRVTGSMKVAFHTVSSPGDVVVRVWPDIGASMCDSNVSGTMEYPEPAAEAVVALPNGPGTVEVTFKKVNFKAIGSMIVQVTPVAIDTPVEGERVFPPSFARILYDTPDFNSRVEFSCIPASGKSC